MRVQRDYSSQFPATADRARRARKAAKITRILEHFTGRDLAGLVCLEMGCSIGVITERLAETARLAIGVDIDQGAIRQAARRQDSRALFVAADVGSVPFMDGTFDVIVCSQVYEHVPSLRLLVSEIYRLLKDDGVCFFSGPNRWAVMERHYGLPFLSWLPARCADQYVRLAGRGQDYYEHPQSARGLRRALCGFSIHDYTPRLLSDPAHFALEEELGVLSRLTASVPVSVWSLLRGWVPNFNWILTKNVYQA
jgi:SAM-dependent methyltransferase